MVPNNLHPSTGFPEGVSDSHAGGPLPADPPVTWWRAVIMSPDESLGTRLRTSYSAKPAEEAVCPPLMAFDEGFAMLCMFTKSRYKAGRSPQVTWQTCGSPSVIGWVGKQAFSFDRLLSGN